MPYTLSNAATVVLCPSFHKRRPRAALEPFVLLLAPYAPHLAEELWARLGHSGSLAYEAWPEADESLLMVDTINLPVQVRLCYKCVRSSMCCWCGFATKMFLVYEVWP
jgi:leucyl-tRNA synthetase